jgi:NAD(P)-dependent dehydrogenase (short-subunit alcohol dehydrogenase family)
MELLGKVALVTGAGKRLGRAIALELAGKGARLVVHYNRSSDDAQRTCAEIAALGGQAVALPAELTDLDQIAKLFAAIDERFGRLDVLVNNAAAFYPTPLDELTPAEWAGLFDVNVRAPVFCMQHAARLMRKAGGGCIINMTDVSVANPWRNHVAYCASKAALAAATISCAKALARDHIRVNAVAPGVIEPAPGMTPEQFEARKRQTLLGRAGTLAELASAITFIIANDYITAQTIAIDGGRSVAGLTPEESPGS